MLEFEVQGGVLADIAAQIQQNTAIYHYITFEVEKYQIFCQF